MLHFVGTFHGRLTGHSPSAGAILERQIIPRRDVSADTAAVCRQPADLGGTAIAVIPLLRDGEADRSRRAERQASWRLLREPNRFAANLRRAGGDRDHQRGDLSRVADPYRSISKNLLESQTATGRGC